MFPTGIKNSSEYKEKRRYRKTSSGGYGIFSNAGGIKGMESGKSDDFSRKGVGDKLKVTGQRRRGRKSAGESQYRKNKTRKRKK